MGKKKPTPLSIDFFRPRRLSTGKSSYGCWYAEIAISSYEERKKKVHPDRV